MLDLRGMFLSIQRLIYIFAFWITALLAWPVSAQNDPGKIIFGTEVELRHPILLVQPSLVYGAINYIGGKPRIYPLYLHDFLSIFWRKAYLHALQNAPKRGVDFKVEGNRVIFPKENFEFQVNLDATTIEITHRPITTQDFQRLSPIIQRFMFDIPRSVGLIPSRSDLLGAGHLHIDIESAFGADAQLFRNFVVDYLNHWELYHGILGNDPLEAKDILQDPLVFQRYRNVIQAFDDGRISSLDALRLALADIGFRKVPFTTQKPAINLDTRFKTIEIRAIRAYRDALDMNLVMQLIQARIKSLKRRETPVPIQPHDPQTSNQQIMMQMFHSYVTGSGLSFETFRLLAPEAFEPTQYRFSGDELVPNPGPLRSCMLSLVGIHPGFWLR
jgi:hypothetical protein